MRKIGKKHKQAQELVSQDQPTTLKNALELVVKAAHTKFDEAVDADIALGIDPTKGEQSVRGAVLLPHGTGKKTRVIVFAKGDYEEAATKAGADFVGGQDLVDKIKDGWMEFDASVATPDMMGLVGKVARLLGPRGLLPNKKVGTVTLDVARVVEELKKGRVAYKNDKGGIIHASFGKVSLGAQKLQENFEAFIRALRSSKPPTSKGRFLKKVTLSSTMGPGVPVNVDEVV